METETTDAKQRVLDVAERLFMERGYGAVTLRDISDELGMRQASLYYHFPDGKEQLFVEMAQRVFQRHHAGMMAAVDGAPDNLRAQLNAVCSWFDSQSPVNFMGMMYADMPALNETNAHQLSEAAYQSMFDPLTRAFRAAEQRGETRSVDVNILAGSFLALLDGITFSQTQQSRVSRHVMSREIVDLLLDGLIYRDR
ncbi:MAG: TetR/AcrR family transcriptional regulator [Caldilineaceae bacterium]|nr:TetR/AcrR family transcriptional regulator [Caldilineaceae bacterium]